MNFFKTIRIIFFVGLMLIGLPAVAYLLKPIKYHSLNSVQGISEIMVADPQKVASRELAILFIGNSYSYFNNMPAIMLNIAASDADNSTRYIVQLVTRDGYRLAGHWKDGVARKTLNSRHWDYVVLQEQSLWAMTPRRTVLTFDYAKKFNNEIKRLGAKTLLFATWARQPNSRWYSDRKFSFLRNSVYMQQQINKKTNNLARMLGTVAVPVGSYWMSVLDKKPQFPLYISDGSHPSIAGSYFTALMFYRYFSGYNSDINYAPDGITDEQAVFLRGMATW